MGTIPTPGTQAASAVVASTLLNGFRDALNFRTGTWGCSAYPTAAQSLANITYTTLALGGEIFDNVQVGDSPTHDLVTNNSRITIRTAGTYLIIGSVGFASNATGARKVQVYKNGATGVAEATTPAVSGVSTTTQAITLTPLAVGDYLELRGYQASGAALNIDPSVTGLFVVWFGL